MTTNAGSDKSAGVVGFLPDEAKGNDEKTEKALSTFLRPEFINRVDEIITFNSLTKADFAQRAKIMLGQLSDLLADKGIKLDFTDEAAAYVAEKSYSQKYGARNMRRDIQKHIEDKLAELIISDYEKSISTAKIFVRDGELAIECL